MTVESILNERENQYGNYSEVAKITQGIKDQLLTGRSYEKLSDEQKLSLDMIANKMARAVNGDVNLIDNYLDICGYSQLVVDSMKKPKGSDMPPISVGHIILEKYMNPMGLTLKQLSDKTEITVHELHRIIYDSNKITVGIAENLANGLGGTANRWLSIQKKYDDAVDRTKSSV